MKTAPTHAFSLVELLVTIAIIAMLSSLAMPQYQRIRQKADSVACSSNLKQIGVAEHLYAQDNGDRYPKIESRPGQNPIYPGDAKAQTPLDAFKDYGVTEKTLQCPADLKGFNYFAKYGCSFDFRPMLDDELTSNPQIYTRHGQFAPPLSRIRIATDFEPVHSGHANRLYADGHVKMY